MTHLELWALLAGESGFLAFEFDGRPVWVPCGERRSFGRLCDACGWRGDLGVHPVAFRDRAYHSPAHSNVLWVRVDTPSGRQAVEGFAPAPTLVVAHGSARTALWGLTGPLTVGWTDALNRRLAHATGAAKKHATAWYSFPPPGSVLREGRSRPVAVTVERWSGELFGARQVAGGLPDPPVNDWAQRQNAV